MSSSITSRLRHCAVAFASVCLLASSAGVAQASASNSPAAAAPLVHFPADQAAHPRVKNEWWYVVGHLRSGSRTFGYEMTVFKFHNVVAPGSPAPISIFRTDVAITDQQGKRFYHRITPYFPQSATVSSKTLAVHVGNASLVGSGTGPMQLGMSLGAGSLNVKLTSRRAPMYVGGRGYLPFGTGFTYYYSLTDLATTGTLRLKGRTYQVTGLSWLDHQWGNWTWSSISGWTWMCLQLRNGVQMSVFDFRGYGSRTRAASVLLPNGSLRTIRDATITPQGTWHSPHTGGNYPAAVTVQIPSLHMSVTVRPTVADQEMVWTLDPRGSYWEGSSRVSGTYAGKPVKGVAYLELTGYARNG